MNKRKLKKYEKKKWLPMPFKPGSKFFKEAGKFPAVKKLTGGQAKLDKNKNNRIDAQDFKILRREKAKGRGMGLQDEKMKPGKPMKAALGAIALGLGAKKMMDKKKMTAPPGVGAAAEIAKKKKEILGKRKGGQMKKDPTKPVNPFQKKPQKKSGVSVLKRVGKGVGRLGVPGAIIGAAAVGAKKIADKIKEKKNKKMGGGMMQRPMGYKAGTMIKARGGGMARSKPTKMY